MKAFWNNNIIAESKDVVNIEGNYYFPIESVNPDVLQKSDTQTVCHWKGTASYYSIEVEGKINTDAAWYYPEPKEMVKGIKGRIAFWKGVKIID